MRKLPLPLVTKDYKSKQLFLFGEINEDLSKKVIEDLFTTNWEETDRILHGVDTRNLDGLAPMFVGKVKQVLSRLAEKGWRPRVAEGLRSVEQQQEKINQGRSSLNDPRTSKHVQGIAVDIIDSRYGWGGPAADLDFEFWNDLGEAAREVGLVWGGDWKSFRDVAHVEDVPVEDSNTTGETVYQYTYGGA